MHWQVWCGSDEQGRTCSPVKASAATEATSASPKAAAAASTASTSTFCPFGRVGVARRGQRRRGTPESPGSFDEGGGPGTRRRHESRGAGSSAGRGHRSQRARGCGCGPTATSSADRLRRVQLSNIVMSSFPVSAKSLGTNFFEFLVFRFRSPLQSVICTVVAKVRKNFDVRCLIEKKNSF